MAVGVGYKLRDWAFDLTAAPASGYGDSFRAGVSRQFGYQPERPAADYLLRMEEQEEEKPGIPGGVHLVERRFARAERQLEAGRPKLALRELEHARAYLPDDDPRSLRYFDARGRALLELKRWDMAFDDFMDGVRVARTLQARGEPLAYLYAGLGRALMEQGKRPEAIRLLEAALKEGPAPARRPAIEDLLLKLKYPQ